jgi:hypothetical protein
MYDTGRGIPTPRQGGSRFETWLHATIKGPSAGTFSRPIALNPKSVATIAHKMKREVA